MSVAEQIPGDLRPIEEAARTVGIPSHIVRRAVKRGSLRGFMRWERLFVSLAELEAFNQTRPYNPDRDELR